MLRSEIIPSSELRPDRLPRPGAPWQELSRFALTFDGYGYSGSFERCADIANRRAAPSLAELHTCLFIEQRRWRHFGEDPTGEDLAYIHALGEKIRALVIASAASRGRFEVRVLQ